MGLTEDISGGIFASLMTGLGLTDFSVKLAMCPGLGVALRSGSLFLMLRPDIIQFGRRTLDVIIGMSVTDFATVGPIDTRRP